MDDVAELDVSVCVTTLDAAELYAAWQTVNPINQIWRMMLRRCENAKSQDYHRYGGRGITIYGPWHDFPVFLRDVLAEVGPRPAGFYASGTPLYSLDRKNNDLGYQPGNIRWATAEQQVNNRRSVRKHQIIPGQRFGRLTVIREAEPIEHGKLLPSGVPRRQRAAEVRCECGVVRVVTFSNLIKKAERDAQQKSCKCGERKRQRRA